ncbi:hypothetical protein GUITHDRAFT_156111 [Guillardia theta CCMP2712]|uniref:Uncharacterized protein n=2 Tax=Guillardia theta TaxID=55529 RepID=L1IBP5_GUITC|nr:hypothetical protein GUITHDRAFT_156111 [Guillardia theta CCMP2712]EKX33260.1 hypothetical protein GUITHDRAFT_156111 [Guillardia theta CCMP2712]|eukprot:XP_005820240.1 hypothetical protein GUITHDRAFT_156111 [Guillardia theta CCMP2712]
MKLSSYEAVVSFESPEGLLAPSKEPAKSNKKPPAQLNIAETSIAISGPMEKTWWWHRPGGMGSDENGQRYDSSSESSQVVLAVEERFQWQAGNFMGNAQAQVKLEDSDVTLDGGISAATALAKKDERAMPNGSKSPAQTSALLDDNTSSVENGKGAKRKLQFHQGGKQGTAVTEGGVKAKAKRMWRRWEPAEDEALKQAVRMHGTKDWISIQSAMKTDRSIKQLQDHWNDLKHDRKHNKN